MSHTITASDGVTLRMETIDRPTSDGTSRKAKVIIMDNPAAPDYARNVTVGYVGHDGRGFQPEPSLPGAMRPELLRAIADLMEGNHP